ncbi:RNA polymerase sigma factor [Candidatus Moduliflexus flocculans]|uniref:RNA polymerase sigma factor n=1 Tax=Candidatus Moduliflexus flocculans TaxID=1499966 RepID=A0A081BQM0_9BACT|nr:RNA polymerase sigma factor [Candidatus Moduliflexus flocculans]
MTIFYNFIDNKNLSVVWNFLAAALSKDADIASVGKRQKEKTQALMTDEELVSFSQRGDTNAFEKLIVRYQRQVFHLIYQMTNNAEVVEDIGQEVFIAAFKGIKDFHGKSSFFTWLYRIAINHCKNYLAASSRSQNFETRYRKEEPIEDVTEDYEENPQSLLLAKEFVEQLEEALATLPPEQRVVLTLCEFQGLSYEEIADILECPVGTIRSRLSRARTALQDILDHAL